ncbi:argininosuccinate lyase [Paracoccus jiaweipingae]|uniref:argininosuccinate lyase n=1 Tax=unclassified Paracoccus (in: a-proteobacteria) TaxID=2688777 RepID=UPI00379D7DCE
MIARLIGLAALAALAGCGVDGAPVRPAAPAGKVQMQGAVQVSVSGDARVGVAGAL